MKLLRYYFIISLSLVAVLGFNPVQASAATTSTCPDNFTGPHVETIFKNLNLTLSYCDRKNIDVTLHDVLSGKKTNGQYQEILSALYASNEYTTLNLSMMRIGHPLDPSLNLRKTLKKYHFTDTHQLPVGIKFQRKTKFFSGGKIARYTEYLDRDGQQVELLHIFYTQYLQRPSDQAPIAILTHLEITGIKGSLEYRNVKRMSHTMNIGGTGDEGI